MFRLELKDRTKTTETAVYYMNDRTQLQELWRREENCPDGAEFFETEMQIGAKQDFVMEKSRLEVHNTKGQPCCYYAEHLLVKIRWIKDGEDYKKVASFVASGIAKKNEYDEGGYEQVVCCGNPVLHHSSSEITPLVSDFEDDFKREKITMLCYKEIARFSTLDEVNADIAKKDLSVEELELLFRDLPGEIG